MIEYKSISVMPEQRPTSTNSAVKQAQPASEIGTATEAEVHTELSEQDRTDSNRSDCEQNSTAFADSNPVGSAHNTTASPQEYGGRKGLEPTRYGDWEKNGRCIDF